MGVRSQELGSGGGKISGTGVWWGLDLRNWGLVGVRSQELESGGGLHLRNWSLAGGYISGTGV